MWFDFAVTLRDEDDESQSVPSGMRYEHGRLVPHLTVEERVARGKAARQEVPRSSHAEFRPGDHRVDPVTLLEQQAATRVPELVPIRYGRMLVSPFTFTGARRSSWPLTWPAPRGRGSRPRSAATLI
jgi:hypothetical protein